MATQFLIERAKWKKVGKPVRSAEKIQELFNICNACEHYIKNTETSGNCGICKCNLKNVAGSLNKLAWATTRCPLPEPKWMPEPAYVDVAASPEEIQIEESLPDEPDEPLEPSAPQPPKSRGCGCRGG